MKQKTVKIIWAVFILVIMVSSVIGFMYQPENTNEVNDGSVNYNGFKFINNNGYWVLEKDGQSYYFTNLPDDVKSIEIPQISINNQKQYFLYVDACIKEENCPNDWPVKDCTNDGFYFKISNQSRVYKDDKCYVLEGSLTDINKEVDKINYIILGVFGEWKKRQ